MEDLPLGSEPASRSFAYVPLLDHIVERSQCFLCGQDLQAENATKEHIIPRWTQREFQLWNLRMSLINETHIAYKNLTIPCCKACNQRVLAPFERRMSAAVRSGYAAVARLDRQLVYLWLLKVYYGMMYRQLWLAHDRRAPTANPIMPKDYFDQYFWGLHMCLQTLRKVVSMPRLPGSLFLFRAQEHASGILRWDYHDSIAVPFVSIRMGPVALMATFHDHGSIERRLDPRFGAAQRIALHPTQYLELTALVLWYALTYKGKSLAVSVLPRDPQTGALFFLSQPDTLAFGDFSLSLYSTLLHRIAAAFPGYVVRVVHNGEPQTHLLTSDRKPLFLPWDIEYGEELR